MAKKITSKGKLWELMNSIWMLWAIATIGFFNYISFFYIAYRVKQRKWTIWGIVYSIPFIMYMAFEGSVREDSLLYNLMFAAIIISWFGSIFHVFKIRAEYLIRLEQHKKSRVSQNQIEELRSSIQKEYEQNSKNVPTQTEKKLAETKQVPVPTVTETVNPIDINTASEEEIANIPSLGAILAKKVVSVREQKGGFASLDEFTEALNIKPHVRERIKPFVVFSTIEKSTTLSPSEQSGRLVDF
ncbi:ComEA family DNA-binding protein [Cytobacillus sp. FJAT-54145]|uniref:ComEA family DNA-binding protein n=1 Tax=Cytobacillus spartinae TaxID=3299023 RepID=A0ABW6K8X3_9BACI